MYRYILDCSLTEILPDYAPFAELIQIIDTLRIVGAEVFISTSTKSELQIACDLYTDFENGNKRAKDTNIADALEILLNNVREIKAGAHLYEIIYDGPHHSCRHVQEWLWDDNQVIFITSIQANSGAPKLLLVKGFNELRLINVEYICCHMSLREHLGRDRVYHFSKKHGDSTHPAQNGASQLECTEKRASELLSTAIQLKDSNRAYNWDEKLGKYIQFFYEGDNPQVLWHGFHISTQQEVKKIPPQIKKLLK